MASPHYPKHPSNRDPAGIKLMVLAFVLGMLALAADLIWMVPKQSSVTAAANASATQEKVSPTSYYASQFSLPARESE